MMHDIFCNSSWLLSIYNSRLSSLPSITDAFFSDVVDFQDSATSSNELPGSSLTSLGTLQKKET